MNAQSIAFVLNLDVKGFQGALTKLRGEIQNTIDNSQALIQTLAGSAIKLEEQIIGIQATIASTNQVLAAGITIDDPLQRVEALRQPVLDAIEQIRQKSLELAGVTSDQLIEVFQIVSAQIGQIGGTLNDAVTLTTDFAAALGTLGIPLFQAQQEIGSILTATIDFNSRLAKSLNITNEQVRVYKEQGVLVDKLNERFSALTAGQALVAKTFSGVTSNIEEQFERLQEAFGRVILPPVLNQLTRFYEFLAANRPALEEFVATIGVKIGQVVTAIGEAIGALQPLVEEVAKIGSAIGEALGGVAVQTIRTFLGVITPLATVLATILKPLAEFLNSDFGKITVQLGVAVTAFNALTAVVATLISIYGKLTAAQILLTTTAIKTNGAFIVASSTTAGFTLALNSLAISIQATAASAATLVAPFLGFAAALGTGVVAIQAFKQSAINESVDIYSKTVDQATTFTLKLAQEIKQLNATREKNGKLTEQEEARLELLNSQILKQAKGNQQLIAELKEFSTQVDGPAKNSLLMMIAGLERVNEAASNVKIAAIPIAELGTSFEQLANKAQGAIAFINKGVGDPIQLQKLGKELTDLTKQQIESGAITIEQANKQLEVVINNTKLEFATIQSAIKAREELYKKEAQTREELKSQEIKAVEALVKQGQLSEIESARRVSDLTLEQLQRREQDQKESFARQLSAIADAEKQRQETLLESRRKAQQDLKAFEKVGDNANAQARADEIKTIDKEILESREQLASATVKLERENTIELGKIQQERSATVIKLQEQEYKERLRLLERANAEAQQRQKELELANQAEILKIRRSGFDSDEALRVQEIERSKAVLEQRINDLRAAIEQEKQIIAESTISLEERATKLQALGNKELEVQGLVQQGLEKQFEQEKLLATIDRVQPLERQSEQLKNQNSLLQEQANLLQAANGLREAQIGLEQSINNAQVANLQEALKLRESSLTATEKEQEAARNALNEQQVQLGQISLAKQRLAELGINAGATEQEIALKLFQQTERQIALDRQAFEAKQEAARQELEIRQRIQAIANESALVDAQVALANAQANQASAEQLALLQKAVGLRQQSIVFANQGFDLAKQTLVTQQQSATIDFQREESAKRFQIQQQTINAGVEPALIGVRGIATALTQSASASKETGAGLVTIANASKIAAQNAEIMARNIAAAQANQERLNQMSDYLTEAFKSGNAELDRLRQGFATLTVEDPFSDRVKQALSVRIKTADSLELEQERLQIDNQLEDIQKRINEATEQGNRKELESLLIARQRAKEAEIAKDKEIAYNNRLIELKKQKDHISESIADRGGFGGPEAGEQMRILAQQLNELGDERRRQLGQEAIANQRNAQENALAVQRIRGEASQLLNTAKANRQVTEEQAVAQMSVTDRVDETRVAQEQLTDRISNSNVQLKETGALQDTITDRVSNSNVQLKETGALQDTITDRISNSNVQLKETGALQDTITDRISNSNVQLKETGALQDTITDRVKETQSAHKSVAETIDNKIAKLEQENKELERSVQLENNRMQSQQRLVQNRITRTSLATQGEIQAIDNRDAQLNIDKERLTLNAQIKIGNIESELQRLNTEANRAIEAIENRPIEISSLVDLSPEQKALAIEAEKKKRAEEIEAIKRRTREQELILQKQILDTEFNAQQQLREIEKQRALNEIERQRVKIEGSIQELKLQKELFVLQQRAALSQIENDRQRQLNALRLKELDLQRQKRQDLANAEDGAARSQILSTYNQQVSSIREQTAIINENATTRKNHIQEETDLQKESINLQINAAQNTLQNLAQQNQMVIDRHNNEMAMAGEQKRAQDEAIEQERQRNRIVASNVFSLGQTNVAPINNTSANIARSGGRIDPDLISVRGQNHAIDSTITTAMQKLTAALSSPRSVTINNTAVSPEPQADVIRMANSSARLASRV